MNYSDELVSKVMLERFGFSSFLPAQYQVIRQLLDAQDTLAIMPTGSGKSLCYQLPALIFEGLTLVVSPMISLMKDQVMQMAQLGIAARMYNSMVNSQEQAVILKELAAGQIKLLYVAPETLMKTWFLESLKAVPISLIAIDEAHCISMWGHDFRPEYRQLANLKKAFPKAVYFALTATAIPKVREDICQILRIPAQNMILESFDRPNLLLAIKPKKDSYNRLLDFLNQHSGESGIIYCMTRKKVDSIADKLQSEGYSVLPYHAGLSDAERHKNQEKFIRDEVQLMVATIAFGMGINKSNIRFVVHMDLPKSLETYYQEIGRAGRDGLPSACLLFFSKGDILGLNNIIYSTDDAQLNRVIKANLDAMILFCETPICRRKPLLGWFGEDYTQSNCQMCDNCLGDNSEKIDASTSAQKFISAAYRCQEAYGVEQIIRILRGSKAKSILDNKDDQLSVYGIGKDISAADWYNLYQALKQQHCITEGYPGFRVILNEKSWAILRGTMKFEMPKSLLQIMVEPVAGVSDHELFDLLVDERRIIAQERKVPPYIIFSDRTLREMAQRYPQTEEEFKRITGVGDYKAKEFGSRFSAVISSYCQPRGLESRTPNPVSKPEKPGKIVSRSQEVAEYIKSGHNLQQAMVQFGVQLTTIIEHLQQYLESDGWLDPSLVESFSALKPEDAQRIKRTFEEYGLDRLSPVYQALKEEFSYLELRLIRLIMITKLKQEHLNR